MSRHEIRLYDYNETSTVIGFNDRAVPEDSTSIHDFFSSEATNHETCTESTPKATKIPTINGSSIPSEASRYST